MPADVITSWGRISIPPDLPDHDHFEEWYRSADLPEEARVGYIQGHLWIEFVSESAFAHNRVKTCIAETVGPLVRAEKLGVYFGDGMTFHSRGTAMTTVPDGMFVSRASDEAGRVWLEGAKPGQHDTKLVGTPDMVLEVVSDDSEIKDTEWLMSAYHDAGVSEYWLIDARRDRFRFTIHRREPTEYAAARKAKGWQKSPAFGRSFRLTERPGLLGKKDYTLEVR